MFDQIDCHECVDGHIHIGLKQDCEQCSELITTNRKMTKDEIERHNKVKTAGLLDDDIFINFP